jgi:hypothetical protein
MEFVLVLVVVAVVVLVITGPLRSLHSPSEADDSPERADLEAAKEAKFREIRDAEHDYRTGKLSREDWRAMDGSLRAEAVELLRRIDALGAPPPRPEDKEG